MTRKLGSFGAGRGLGPRASRRRLLQAGLAIGTLAVSQRPALAQSGGAHGHGHMPELGWVLSPVVPAMDQPLVEPEVRRSADGVLSTSLRCAYVYRDIGGRRLYLRSYEGGSPGPTLRLKPGETLKIRLVNDLPPNRDQVPQDWSRPHQFNNTNFHLHGAHCSPSDIADNVMRSMQPGKTYDIEIALPTDHTRGTYWYHPHHHGSASIQVANGMAGAIVVEGDFAEVPEIAQARERVMVLGQVVFDVAGTVEDFYTVFPESATRFLAINGQDRPTIDMRPGEVQRWRLVGSQYRDDMLLELDRHRLNVIAYDGIQLGAVREMKQLLIAPGQRADVLVQAGGPGSYELNAMPFDQGHPSPSGPMARVVVAGEPLSMKLPAALPKPPLETIRDSEITGRRTLVLSTFGDAPGNYPGALWPEFRFMVDGQAGRFSISPTNRISPSRPPSAIATACFSFAVSKATYTSLCSPMVRPSMPEARLGPSKQPSILGMSRDGPPTSNRGHNVWLLSRKGLFCRHCGRFLTSRSRVEVGCSVGW